MVLIVLGLSLSPSLGEPRTFRAGAAKSNITPWLGVTSNGQLRDRKTTTVHDELQARCLVLDDGTRRLAFAVVDSCVVAREVHEDAKRIIERETGLPPGDVLISATHTHSGAAAASVFQSEADPEYQRFLARRIADGVGRAVVNLAPARIGWGVGKVPEAVHSRRWKMKPEAIAVNPFGYQDQVVMHPEPGSPYLIEPAGPTDPDVSFLAVESQQGRPIALLANYSLHYVGGTPDGEISADYFGVFAEQIERLLEAQGQEVPFVGIMSNGTSGDAFWIDVRQPIERELGYGQICRIGRLVAAEVFRVYQTVKYHDWVSLDAAETEIYLGVRRPTDLELEEAHRIVASSRFPLSAEELAIPGGEARKKLYAREAVLLSQYPEKIGVPLQALRIGELAVLAVPCETFSAIGLELKAKSPFSPTFTIELANGYNGYLPTPEQFELGGYETWRARSSYLEVEAAPKIVSTLLDLLKRLHESYMTRPNLVE